MIKTRHIKHYLTLLVVFSLTAFIAVSCSDSPTGDGGIIVDPTSAFTVKDLNAATGNRGKAGKYTFFSLKNNKIILNNTSAARSDSATTKWDIAFSGRTIIVNGGENGPGNGGALILDVSFNKVTKAPTEGYTEVKLPYPQWANYTGQTAPKHAFLPKENTTIVVKTADGNHVAKVKIISWYKGNPDPDSPDFADPFSRTPGYFTFKYNFLK